MLSYLNHVSAILRRQSSPALSLTDLLGQLRNDVPGILPTRPALLQALEREPSRFAVIHAESGERSLDQMLGIERNGGGSSLPSGRGPWVICTEPGVAPRRTEAQALVRETLAYLGHGLDGQSARAVARWLELLEECGRVGERLRSDQSPA